MCMLCPGKVDVRDAVIDPEDRRTIPQIMSVTKRSDCRPYIDSFVPWSIARQDGYKKITKSSTSRLARGQAATYIGINRPVWEAKF